MRKRDCQNQEKPAFAKASAGKLYHHAPGADLGAGSAAFRANTTMLQVCMLFAFCGTGITDLDAFF